MNEVQEHLDSLALYGSEAGDAACPACGHPRAIHGVYGCHEGDAVVFTEEIVALRAKVALFDVLAAREHVWQDRRLTVFNAAGQDLIYHAPTLAEAIEKAMEAKGGDR